MKEINSWHGIHNLVLNVCIIVVGMISIKQGYFEYVISLAILLVVFQLERISDKL